MYTTKKVKEGMNKPESEGSEERESAPKMMQIEVTTLRNGYALMYEGSKRPEVVGFIFLLIFTFNDSNINRRNYARSFWCIYVIVAIIFAVMLTIALISGVSISRLLS